MLLKVVLKSILFYWESIAYIPKGILTKIRKKCFSFLWMARKQAEGIPLVKWRVISLPKVLGGWGVKNLELFCKAIAAKNLWRLFQNLGSLSGRIILSKYCSGLILTDWIRRPVKTYKNGSIGWKALILAFRLVGNWTTWKKGNGKHVRLGEDSWSREGENFGLPS